MHLSVILGLLVYSCVAQDFICDVELRSPQMTNGILRGKFTMSMTTPPRVLTTFLGALGTDPISELVILNDNGGFNGMLPIPYVDQYSTASALSCTCEPSTFHFSTPLLSNFDQTTNDLLNALYTKESAQVNGCDVYKQRLSLNPSDPLVTTNALNKIKVPLTEIHINPLTKLPCAATWYDGRKHNYSNCAATPFDSFTRKSVFPEQFGCKCGRALDVALVLGQAGPITKVDFYDLKGFVLDFTRKFDYGSLMVNLCIVNFQEKASVLLDLKDGIDKQYVQIATESMRCQQSCGGGNEADSICLCGTGSCMSCGIRAAADQLASGRSFAHKIIVTFTNGVADYMSDSTPCRNNSQCNSDLQSAVDYAYNKLGGQSNVGMYTIAVGTDQDISIEQLLLVSGGIQDHVMLQTYPNLSTTTIELASRSCEEVQSPCGPCCGVCICGRCQPLDSCDDISPCTKSSVPRGGVCCSPVPTKCSATSDSCNNYVCDDNVNSPTAGQCIVNSTVTCLPVQNDCFNRSCAPATGLCVTSKNATCTGITECSVGNLSNCNDNNMCTTDACTADGSCQWTKVNCETILPPNSSFDTECDPILGCRHKKKPANFCDDYSVCTTDTCDNNTGCRNTNIMCSGSGDRCTDSVCDPLKGCLFFQRLCPVNHSAAICEILSCNSSNGKCQSKPYNCPEYVSDIFYDNRLFPPWAIAVIVVGLSAIAVAIGGGVFVIRKAPVKI